MGRRHDRRDDVQRGRDREARLGQVANLGTRPQDQTRIAALVDLMVARQDESRRVGKVGRLGAESLVAWGEVLLRTEDAAIDWVAALLERRGFVTVPVAGLDDRLTRASNTGLRPDQLDALTRALRLRGVDASVNHIAPLAPIAKGLGGPSPTASTLPAPPPAADPAPVVALIDTGIVDARGDGWLQAVARHPSVAPPPRPGEDPLDYNVDPLDILSSSNGAPVPGPDGFLDYGAGHGTFAAGIIQQVAPDAVIRVYRALDSDGIGDEVAVAVLMVHAVRGGADVLNLSLGAQTVDDLPPVAMTVALEIIEEETSRDEREVLVVAAAGNFGDTRPCYPAAFRRVVSVAALTADGVPAPWSSRGFWVDCSTVGEGLLSTYVEGVESPELDAVAEPFPGPDPWAIWSGTSFAAPQVAGAVAAAMAATPGLGPHQAVAALLAQGRPVLGYGRGLGILPGT